jgi:DNA repair photolyase
VVSASKLRIDTEVVKSILTRASGYLRTVCSHSLQPYRGCPLGHSLCGVGCYVQHNRWLLRGEAWGGFLVSRSNAADAYRAQVDRERRWARRERGTFAIFLSSATEPFPPQEQRFGTTRGVLEAMLEAPPDVLIVQTHSPSVVRYLDILGALATRCRLRVHLSVESDRARLPGLPPPASAPQARLEAAARVRAAGIETVVTVSPLLPIEYPDAFFARIAEVADAVVLDHFIGGDGSATGARTQRTPLVAAMAKVDPASVGLGYRDAMVAVARRHLPGRVGISIDGFAGRFQ